MKRQERGLGLVGLILVSAMVAVFGLVLVQVVPTVIEYQTIQRAAQRAAQGNTVAEVRNLFDKAAAIDDIHSIDGRDLEISKQNDQVIVEFAYEREIHLAGPAWLVMRYSGRSK
ncbi:DUF4845 domain-containing protein [Malikia granosa]|uniref:DUF4845 domain-containing protein n=1 Tax=Malikia granosa TaxID=263067 RepID=A0A2S9K800_9BURK|nr:DUF4845 domain-containing protein [Malikia granosa]PRD66583.1 DUF4845 domain-containing protein [Malikia granosa]